MDTKKFLKGIQDFRKTLESGGEINLEDILNTIEKFDEVVENIDYKECHEYCRIRYELYECKLYLQTNYDKQILNYVNPYDTNRVRVKKFSIGTLKSLNEKLPESKDCLLEMFSVYSKIISRSKDDSIDNFYEGLKLCAEIEGNLYGNI